MKNLILILTILSFTVNLSGQNKGKIDFQFNRQGNFIVNAGETKRISLSRIYCEKFIMHDNSTIIIDAGSWSLDALQTEIGNNCKIIAHTNNGATGGNGGNGGSASKCKKGKRGGDGGTGGNGNNGKSITIKSMFVSVGNLRIEASGGNGGNGGIGGKGGKGGGEKYEHGFKKCGGGDGGNGGTGGNAGVGGNGGNISISYSESGINPSSKTIVVNSKGKNGNTGAGGEGGNEGGDKSKGSRGGQGQPASTSGIDGKSSYTQYDEICLEDGAAETEALIIWVSQYQKPEPTWQKQALELKTLLEKDYNFTSVTPLNNPTADELQKTLINYSRKGTNLLIYLTGHGVEYNSRYVFKASNELDITFDEIFAMIEKTDLKNLLFIMDACYSGKLLDHSSIDRNAPTSSTLQPPYLVCGLSSRTIITAGYENQSVDTQLTEALITVLKDNEESYLTASQLFYDLIDKSKIEFKRRPSFGRMKAYSDGDFIFYHQ
jgi:hypothetical protein